MHTNMARRTSPTRRSHPLGGMAPEEFCHLAPKVYGPYWKLDMAKEFGVDRVTIWRWSTGRSTISVPTAMALRAKAAAIKPKRR